MTRTPLRTRRDGFTLVEVLVVLTIILVLIGMSVGAYMKIANYQQRRNTETLSGKLDGGLQKQWRAVLDTAKSEQPNPIAVSLANGDTRRAQVIHVLMCLRREFPTSFAEAVNPSGGVSGFGPNPAYARLLQPVSGNYTPEVQSSVCLYMALKQKRRGIDFDPDTALSSQEVGDPPNSAPLPNGLKVIYDGWKQPVIFNRWPNPNGTPPNYGLGMGSPAVGSALPFNTQAPPDTEDPEGLLTDAAWQQWLVNQGLLATFNQAVGYPLAGAGQQYHLSPVILSLGANGKYDGAVAGSDDVANVQLTPLNQ